MNRAVCLRPRGLGGLIHSEQAAWLLSSNQRWMGRVWGWWAGLLVTFQDVAWVNRATFLFLWVLDGPSVSGWVVCFTKPRVGGGGYLFPRSHSRPSFSGWFPR